jgi:DNA-binding CsgD family transcriptional regulator
LKWYAGVEPNEIGAAIKDGIVILGGWVDSCVKGWEAERAAVAGGDGAFGGQVFEGVAHLGVERVGCFSAHVGARKAALGVTALQVLFDGRRPRLGPAALFAGLNLVVYTDDLARGKSVLGEALALSRAAGEPWGLGYSAYGLGHLAARLADSEGAREWFEQSLALLEDAGNRWGVGYSLYRLSLLTLGEGDVPRAEELQKQSLSLSWDLRNKRGMAVSAEVLACLAGIQRHGDRAARLFGVATALLDAANYVLPPTLFELHERGNSGTRAALGEAACAAAFEEGRRMPLVEGVRFALDELVASGLQASGAIHGAQKNGLTPRQAEVAQLVSKGLTDRQVAALLSINHRTVDGHLRRIFAKLGAQSRSAVAAWAVQHPLT